MKNQRLIGLLPEMTALDQWVCFELTEIREDGKGKKTPKYLDNNTLRFAKTNDPSTWMSFDKAVQVCEKYKLSGVGFVFTENDPFIGIDLDKCRNKNTGEIETWAKDIIYWLNSYTEITPSGLGFHIIVTGTIDRALKQDQLEIYSTLRYFTMTGDVLGEDLLEVKDCSQQLKDLMAFMRERENEAKEPTPIKRTYQRSSQDDQDDYTKAEEALKRLSSWRCDDHNEWVAVGMSLRSLGQNGFYLWNSWSKQSSKYNQKECEKRWRSFQNGGNTSGTIRLSSLFYWANQDDPSGKYKKKQKYYSSVVEDMSDTKEPESPENDFSVEVTELKKSYNLTDQGNAQRLIDLHGKDLKYCHPWGKWFVWDGKRWIEDKIGETYRRTVEMVKSIYHEASQTDYPDKRKALAQWAHKSEANAKIKSTMEAASNIDGVYVLPEQFNNNYWLLNCQNGSVDLRTGKLYKHKREDLSTKVVAVDYSPNAECPTFQKFINWAMCGQEDKLAFLHTSLGYCLTGDTSEQCLFFLHGSGGNGKSTLLNTILDLLGEYAMQAAPELLTLKATGENHPTQIAELFGARFVASIEVDDGKRLAESLVKQMTGGDRLKGRKMREDFFEFKPTHKLFVAANYKPVIRGTDDGIWRRIHLIPFDAKITKEEKDKELPEKLKAEWPGILAWLVRGCLRWQKEGLLIPADVIQATKTYRAEMDQVGRFIEECCHLATNAIVAFKTLYAKYGQWCTENGEFQISGKAFSSELNRRGIQEARVGNDKGRRGIGVLTDVIAEF